MAHSLHFLLMALLLSGCASGPRLSPASQSASIEERRPASELVTRGREAAARGDAVRAEQYLSLAIDQGADRRTTMPLLQRQLAQRFRNRTSDWASIGVVASGRGALPR